MENIRSLKTISLWLLLLYSINSVCMMQPAGDPDKNMRGSLFPRELFMIIGAASGDEIRDALLPVCKFLYQNLSIKVLRLQEVVSHPLFNTADKNKTFIAFNAAWNNQLPLLKCILPKMKQSDYEYKYPISVIETNRFNLADLIVNKMFDKISELQNLAKEYGCVLKFYNLGNKPDCDLEMAGYNKDSVKIEKVLSSTSESNWNYAWEKLIFIAIDKDSSECIDTLSSLYKVHEQSNPLIMYEAKTLTIIKEEKFQQFFHFIELAIKAKKYNAFQALIKNDIFSCLNFVCSCPEIYSYKPQFHIYNTIGPSSILDCIIEHTTLNELSDRKKYIDICRRHGGKTVKEINNRPCSIQ